MTYNCNNRQWYMQCCRWVVDKNASKQSLGYMCQDWELLFVQFNCNWQKKVFNKISEFWDIPGIGLEKHKSIIKRGFLITYEGSQSENVSPSVVSDSLWPPWTVSHQALLSIGLSIQEYWSGFPFPSPGDLPNPGFDPGSPALQADSLLSEPSAIPGKLEIRGEGD